MNEQIEVLSRRLEHLERANRRIKAVAVATACVLVAAVAMAAANPAPKALKARSIQLVDSSGHALAVLAESPKGPALSFLDASGNPMLQVGAAPKGCESAHDVFYKLGCAPGLFAFSLRGAQRVSLNAGLDRPRASN
jgi:hypothetical protein